MAYLIILIFIFTLSVYYLPYTYEVEKKILILSIYCTLGIIIGIRHYDFGIDTIQYYSLFENIKYENLLTAFDTEREEWGYILSNKIISAIGGDYYCFQIIFSLSMMVLLCNFIENETKYVLTATIIFLGAGYFAYSYNIMRQMMAISIAANGWVYLSKKKYYLSYLLLLFSVLFHKLAVLYIIAYLLYAFRNSKIISYGFPFLIIIIGLYIPKLMDLSLALDFYADYTNRPGNTGGFVKIVWMIEAILISIILVSKKFNNKDKCIANLSLWCVSFFYFDSQLRYLDRIGLFFFPFVLIMFCSFGAKFFKSRNYKTLYFASVDLCFIMYLIYTNAGLESYKSFLL